MPENNQTPGNNSSEAVPMSHANAIVPHKISNHKVLAQTSVMVDGQWININDANDQANAMKDLHRVNSAVAEAQKDIVNAKNVADSAVSGMESAINDSKVNSAAISAMSAAVSEAESDMQAAIASANESIKNVASDAQAIRNKVSNVEAQITSDQNINASSVKQLQSDISNANQSIATANDNLAKAKSAAEESHKAIESNVAAIQTAVAQNAKDIQAAQAANSDTAKQLATYTSEAQAQGKTIKQIESDADTTRMTIADIKGNVTQVQTSVTGLQGSLKDTNNNVATVKAQADSLSSTLTDAKKGIANLTATATKLSSSLQDADGRLSTVEQTASEHSSTISDLKGNLSQLKQTADSLTATLKDAQSNITQVQATAKGLSEQMSNAQGDINDLQKTATGIQSTLEDHSKNITALQARAGKLEADMSDAQSNITTAQQTASGASVTASNAAKDAASAVVTASAAKVTASDANSNAAQAVLTASNAGVVAKDAKSDVFTAAATASDARVVATNAKSQAAHAELTANNFSMRIAGVEKTTSEVSSSVSGANATANNAMTKANQANTAATGAANNASNAVKQASQAVSTANGASSKANSNAQSLQKVVTQVTTNTTNITATQKELQAKADQATIDNVKGTLTDLSGKVSVVAGEISSKADKTTITGLNNTINGLKNSTQWKTVSGALDANNLKTTQRIFYQDTQAKNTPNSGWFYLIVDAPRSDRITQTLIRDNSTDTWTRFFMNNMWSMWDKVADSTDISNLRAQVIKNSTSISNNANAINLKADKSVTDALNKTVQQQSAQQTIMANEIKSKVSQADMTNYIDGKGFATVGYVMSRVDQQDNNWNVTIAKLQGSVKDNQNAIDANNAKIYTNTSNISNLTVAVDGLQSTVKNFKDNTESRFTQLANGFQTKVFSAINNASVRSQKFDSTYNTLSGKQDLNKMFAVGNYYIPDGVTNGPTGSSAKHVMVSFWIDDNNRAHQTYVGDLDSCSYVRESTGTWFKNMPGTWGAWQQASDTDETTLTQTRTDLNLRVGNGHLLSQINMEAGRTLIQSNKIYMDADTIVFGPNSKAFIPDAAITNLNVDKLIGGTSQFVESAWNSINNYVDITANGLRAGSSGGGYVELTSNGMHVYDSYNNEEMGWIHGNHMKNDPAHNGLEFDLQWPNADYMGWAVQNQENGLYERVLTYERNGYNGRTDDGGTFHSIKGLNIYSDVQFSGYIYPWGDQSDSGKLKVVRHKMGNQIGTAILSHDEKAGIWFGDNGALATISFGLGQFIN